jgi:dTDP-glucose 4,6-dehydratase
MEIVAGDVRDPFAARDAARGCEAIFHLAALIAIPYSYVAPQAYVETNVGGTLNLLMAARDAEVERFVHTSTSEVYGTAQRVPIDEEHPLHPQSPYAASKVGADQLALSFHRSFGLPVTVVRPFNTYGPRQSARAVLPTIITQIASGAKEVRLGALSPTRDFNFVRDTADGFAALAACDAAVGEVVNLGSDFEISIGDAARLVAEVMGKEIAIVTDAARLRPATSEVERLWASNAKVKRLAGFAPAHGGRDGFRRGLEATVAWYTDPANLSRFRPEIYNV